MTDTDLLASDRPRHADRIDATDVTAISSATPVTDSVRGSVAMVEIAIPVYNEEGTLESSIRRLRSYLDHSFPFSAAIVIVDNASVDGTWGLATRLCDELDGVSAIHLGRKGRGRAIRAAWTASRSEVVAYMDVDLSTDLDGLLPLVAPLVSGHSQVAIGSRIASGSRVLRGGKREFISRTYNLILRSTLRCRFSDAQCGFKAMRRDAVDALLGMVEDEAWFFDTELLIQAERHGFRIHEVSVDWIDDPDTRVHIVSTAREDLKGVWRLARQRTESSDREASLSADFAYHHEMARYASVGVLSTLAYLIIFLLLRDPLGTFGANLVAATVTAVGNTAAHVTFTFRANGRGQTRRAVIAGVLSFAIGIGLTSATLAFTYLAGKTSSLAEGVAILVGMVTASCIRFVLLREWAYRIHARQTRTTGSASGALSPPDGVLEAA